MRWLAHHNTIAIRAMSTIPWGCARLSLRLAFWMRGNDLQATNPGLERRCMPSFRNERQAIMTGVPPLPAPYLAFLDRFSRGEFWEAHEVLEGAWREGRSGFYKGLILLASAFVHAGRGNAHGVGAQLAKARRELAPYAPAYLGQDVAALLRLAARGEEIARIALADVRTEWAPDLSPPDLTPDPALFRGGEPELQC